MNRILSLLALIFLFSCEQQQNKGSSPNIIYILADDLGYGELGAYGQTKIETPHIDALAKSGMLFTQHYSSAPVCAPARYMLLTGQHSGKAYIRGNDEWADRGAVWDYKAVINDPNLEGQRPMPEGTITLAKRLQNIGYNTALFGKWGLGAPLSHATPNKMGFDYFYGYNCQRQAHTYYPVHLYENEKRVYLNNDTIAPHTKLSTNRLLSEKERYAPFTLKDYAPELIFDKITQFLDRDTQDPFFLYWATPIPHNALQAPEKWLNHYIQKFGKEKPYLGEIGYFPHKNPRAAYAAMISYLDENIGKLIGMLKDSGRYENTLIIFTSDNGVTYSGGTDGMFFNSSGPFGEDYGRGKGFVYEGGIRVPMIASWPGQIEQGSQSDLMSIQYDVQATLSDITGFELPENQDGISFLPSLLSLEPKNKHDYLYWEFPEYGGQLAIRMGDFKLVRQHLKDSLAPTLELYDLKNDPEELYNVADKHPDILKKAAIIFEQSHSKAEIERFHIPILENGLFSNDS
ncbi:MAG: arylsulfatase [Flavobacteriia bacterium]|nr:arylsulfatase [Flavobacteriia bacterium]